MSDFIFTTEQVTKKNFYTRLKQIMIAASWQNISSKPSTDYDVMYSTGEAGDKKMIINLKEFDSTATYSAISNSTQRGIDIRWATGYTPGLGGAAGVFTRASGWYLHHIAYQPFSLDSEFTIHYHCNKNRMIIFNEYPSHNSSNYNFGSFIFIGMSDRRIAKEYETTPLLVASSALYSTNMRITDQPDNNRSDPYSQIRYFNEAPRATSVNGTVFMSEIAYGHTDEGIRGFLDGIYAVRSDVPAVSGDILVDSNLREYRLLQMDLLNSSYTSPLNKTATHFVAFRVK